MRLRELFAEGVTISDDIHTKLERAIDVWINGLRDNQDLISDSSPENRRIIGNRLRKILHPTINKLMRDSMNFVVDDVNFKGYQLQVRVEIDDYDVGVSGHVGKTWRKEYIKKPEYVYVNDYVISIPLTTVKHLMNNDLRKASVLATITHELIHLLQSVKSKRGSIRTKEFDKKWSNDDFLSKSELNAYAQGTVTKIIMVAKKHPDPKAWLKSIFKMLSMGMNSLFGKQVFPSQKYEEIKNLCKQDPNNPASINAWKYFNKQIYDKLSQYAETLN